MMASNQVNTRENIYRRKSICTMENLSQCGELFITSINGKLLKVTLVILTLLQTILLLSLYKKEVLTLQMINLSQLNIYFTQNLISRR